MFKDSLADVAALPKLENGFVAEIEVEVLMHIHMSIYITINTIT